MNFLGITLRKPTFLSLTLAAALSTLVWLIVISIANYHGAADPETAGAALVAFFWGGVCAALGLRFRQSREMILYVLGAAFFLTVYQGVYAAMTVI
ncbi:MAG TPA: hypothetical protein VFS42_10235 [Burkholderiaceae bacterium]|nr:hypothetical protein [Burkholderiaceae bacterium]